VKGDSFADGNSTDFDDIATVSLNYSFWFFHFPVKDLCDRKQGCII
jgi:hypothetical protein